MSDEDKTSSSGGGDKKPKFTAEAVTPENAGDSCGPGCNHDHGLNYEKSTSSVGDTVETKKVGFIDRIGEGLKTTTGKVVAFGVVAAVLIGGCMLLNQQEQGQSR